MQRLARFLVRLLLPGDLVDEVTDDLDARHHRRVRDEGRRRAALWYWGQLLRAVPVAFASRSAAAAACTGGALGALKGLRSSPGFAATVALTLALGIGPTTAVLTLADRALLDPLPYRDAGDLVVIRGSDGFLSGPDVADLQEGAATLAGVAAIHEPLVAPMTDVERPLHVRMQDGSWNLLEVLGIEPALGRGFTAEEAAAAAGDTAGTVPRPAVLGHDLWQRAFGGDPEVLGRDLRLWGQPFRVVGVLPRGFRLHLPPELGIGGDVEVFTPAGLTYGEWDPAYRELRVVGRVAGGAAPGQVRGEVEALGARARERRGVNRDRDVRFIAEPLVAAARAPARATLTVFTAAVALVLLASCANAANLLLVRGATRRTELAVRAALGADRRRIAGQLLAEAGVLAFLGAAVGAALAWVGVLGLGRLAPPGLLPAAELRPDGSLLAFAALAGGVAAMAAGAYPALRLSTAAPAAALRSRTGDGGHGRLLSTFAVLQVALSVAVLGAAGLMVRSVAELQAVPLGFEPRGVLTATVTQPLRPQAERRATEEALLREVRALPGVEAAGVVFPLPMNGVYERAARFAPDGPGDASPAPDGWRDAYYRTVSAGYLDAVGLRVLAGRGLREEDDRERTPVVLLDERGARSLWAGQDPVGRHVRVAGMAQDTLRFRVVGVVEAAPQRDHRDRRPTLYLPRAFYRSHEVSVAARVSGDPALLAGALREAVRRATPDLPVDVRPLAELVERALAPTRFVLVLLGAFAALAVAVAAVGIYGVLSFDVRRRTREIGVRLAMGASPPSVTREVVGRGLRLALSGSALGVLGALALGGLLETHLYGVEPTDARALGAAVALILVVALLASADPGRRAAAVEPSEALRYG